MARRRRHTSNPSRSGITTSSTIRSGRRLSACRMASVPLAAVLTAQPWNFSATCTSSRMFGSSSTTSTCGILSLSVITMTHSATWPGAGRRTADHAERKGAHATASRGRGHRRRAGVLLAHLLAAGRPDEDEPGVLGPADHRPTDPDRLAGGETGLADLAARAPDHRLADQGPGPDGAVGGPDRDGAGAVHRLDHAPLVGQRADGAVGGAERELAVDPAQQEEPGEPAPEEPAPGGGRPGRPPGRHRMARHPRRPGRRGRPGA